MDINALTGTGSSPVSRSSGPAVTSTPVAPKADSATPVAATPAAQADAPAATPAAAVKPADIKDVVDAINKRLQPTVGNIQFAIDHDSGQSLIKIVDKTNGDVLLQIPSKQALEIAKDFTRLQGSLIQEKA
jgi:flagellar protein FlaG